MYNSVSMARALAASNPTQPSSNTNTNNSSSSSRSRSSGSNKRQKRMQMLSTNNTSNTTSNNEVDAVDYHALLLEVGESAEMKALDSVVACLDVFSDTDVLGNRYCIDISLFSDLFL